MMTMPDWPWWAWFGLGALLYPWMRRGVLYVVGRVTRTPLSVSGTKSTLKRAFSRSKPSEDDAPTAWDRLQEDDD